MTRLVLVLLFAWLSCAGCRGWTTEEPPIVPIRNMYTQPRYDTQRDSAFFEDGRSMRPEVVGTVCREQDVDSEIATGRTSDGLAWVLSVPAEVVERSGWSRCAGSTWPRSLWDLLQPLVTRFRAMEPAWLHGAQKNSAR